MDINYGTTSGYYGPAPEMPYLRYLTFENIHGIGTNYRGFYFSGVGRVTSGVNIHPEQRLTDVLMKGCSMGPTNLSGASDRAYMNYVNNAYIYDVLLPTGYSWNVSGTTNSNINFNAGIPAEHHGWPDYP